MRHADALNTIDRPEKAVARGYHSADGRVVGQLMEQMTRAVYEGRGRREMHPGQWAVLRYLACATLDERTVGGVAAHLGVTHPPASRAVGTLIRKSYVSMSIDPFDRRIRRLDLTAEGRALLTGDPAHRLASAIEALSTDQRRSLAMALCVVSESLERR